MSVTLAPNPDAVAKIGGTLLNRDPLVYTLDDYLTDAACDRLIALAQGEMKRATVAGLDQDEESSARTNSVHYVNQGASPDADRIQQHLTGLVGLTPGNAEPLQVIHYLPGTEYQAHYDSFDPKTDLGRRYWTSGGQRLITGLIYLNDVERGGATGFPNLGLHVAPKRGRLLVFQLCHRNSVIPHNLAFHAGEPVEAGEKWAVNVWVRQYPFSQQVNPPVLESLP